ncbi:hypothetical protein BH20ACI3_BH20ACI3_23910 [soil metagenome]
MALLVVLILSGTRDALLLLRYPVAVGADGYYYVLQVDELLNHGRLRFPTHTSLVFYLLAGIRALTGDTISSIKIGNVLFHLLLCGGIYALVSAVTGDRWLGVLGSALTAFSGMHFYMIAEFIKNLGALALLAWGAWSAIQAWQTREVRWAAVSIVLLAAAVFTHQSAWAIALSLSAAIILLRGLITTGPSQYHQRVALIIMLVFGILPALIAAQPFIELPPWLGKEIFTRPQWPIRSSSPVGKPEMVALLLISPTILFLLAGRRQIPPTHSFSLVVGAVALWSLLITLNPFLNHDVRQFGIVGRLGHLAYVQVAILVPGLIWLLLRACRTAALSAVALTLFLVAVSLRSSLPEGLRSNTLVNRALMIQALPARRQLLETNPVVIARHGDEFIVTSVLGIPAHQRFPEEPHSRSIYWLLHGVQQARLPQPVILVMDEGIESSLVLIRNEELAQWLDSMTEAERQQLLVENPHLRRFEDN